MQQSSSPLPDPSRFIEVVTVDAAIAASLRAALEEALYRVRMWPDVAALTQAKKPDAHNGPVAIIVVQKDGGSDAGIAAATQIQSYAPAAPLLLMTDSTDLPSRLAVRRAGVHRVFALDTPMVQLIGALGEMGVQETASPCRVLIVDDDAHALEAHALMLRSAGMQVHTLSQPLRFFEEIDAFRPEVVVMDLYMPQMSGTELAEQLRECSDMQHRELPVLFLSVETDLALQLKALELGGDDFLVKPVHGRHLVAAVQARADRARRNNAVRRRLENALYERDREHLALNQHAIVSMTDVAGNIIYGNERFCHTSGYSQAELIGQSHRILKSGQHPPEFYLKMWSTVSSGRVWHGEVCNRRKDGTLYWVDSTIVPFLDAAGKPYQYVSIRTDITHVKQAEAGLRGTLESTTDAILAVDRTRKVIFANRRFITMWGVPEVLTSRGQPDQALLDYVLPKLADPEGFLHQVRELYESDRESHDLLNFKDGRVFDRHSKPMQGVLGGRVWSFHDITDHVRAEQASEAHKERLRRGQMFANIGTWDWQIQTGELHWTERIAPLFGYPEGELETSYENFLNAVHPDDRQSVIDAVTACVERDVPYEIEHRVVWPDGTVRWLLERGAVVRDADGRPVQMLGVVQDVDDRKRAEMALAERESELVQAQSMAHIGNWTADLRTGDLYWSDEIYRIFGHKPGSIKPSVQAFHAAVHPDDRELVHASEKQAEQTGRHDVVHRILRSNGEVRYVHELAQAETDDAGQLVRLTGTVQDVTDRMEAESRLRETEARFAFAVEGAGDGVWDWDMATGTMALSGHYEGMLGFEKGDLPPTIEGWIASVHPDDLPRVQSLLNEYLEGRVTVYAPELRLLCKDGSYKWILCRGTVVKRDGQGAPMRMIGIHSDISLRKESEEHLALFRKIYDTSEQSVGITDREGRLIYLNRAHEEIVGYRAEELIGKSFATFLPPEELQRIEGPMMETLHSGKGWTGQHKMRHKDGHDFVVVSNVGAVKDAKGDIQYLFNIFTDFSEELARRRELAEAKEVAERANQAKSEFLSSMSHELRTPLNAIIGFGQLLEYEESLQADQKDNVHEILKAGHHLLTLINEVLDLAKVESGHINLSLEPVEVAPLVAESMSLVASLADHNEVSLSQNCPPGTKIRADRTRAKQVLLNLLSNAIKYNRRGGTVRIEQDVTENGRLRIRVSDTGHGIAPERLKDLFQPFNRLDAEESGIEGTGIGLTITRRIVEMMGGEVGVESEPGKGSCFWFELPLDADAIRPGEGGQDPAYTGEGAHPEVGHEYTVLYIEDNPVNVKLVAQLMGRRAHIRLLTAHTAELGIELALAQKPDLILLDINLPGMDGYQIMKVFQADEKLKSVPVIAFTANAMPADIEHGKAAGFVDYLTKPVNVAAFMSSLDRHLPATRGDLK